MYLSEIVYFTDRVFTKLISTSSFDPRPDLSVETVALVNLHCACVGGKFSSIEIYILNRLKILQLRKHGFSGILRA